MFRSALSLLLQLALLSLAMAEETAVAAGHGNAWKFGSGGGIIGLIVLVLDIVAILEIVKSSRPPLRKVLWALAVFFFPIIGLVVYYFFQTVRRTAVEVATRPLCEDDAKGKLSQGNRL